MRDSFYFHLNCTEVTWLIAKLDGLQGYSFQKSLVILTHWNWSHCLDSLAVEPCYVLQPVWSWCLLSSFHVGKTHHITIWCGTFFQLISAGNSCVLIRCARTSDGSVSHEITIEKILPSSKAYHYGLWYSPDVSILSNWMFLVTGSRHWSIRESNL